MYAKNALEAVDDTLSEACDLVLYPLYHACDTVSETLDEVFSCLELLTRKFLNGIDDLVEHIHRGFLI